MAGKTMAPSGHQRPNLERVMSLNPLRRVLPIAIASVLAVQPVLAQDATSGPTLDLRYRYENVNDDAFARNANAHTLRARFGYHWVASPRWAVFAEGEYGEGLGSEKG